MHSKKKYALILFFNSIIESCMMPCYFISYLYTYRNLSCNRSWITVFYLSYQSYVCVSNLKHLIIAYMSLSAREVVYCGNDYACYAQAARCRSAERAYIVERLHLAVGRADVPSFSDFQKLISR